MVARLQQAHDAGQNRRHAGGGGDAEFRAFQGGQALLEHADRGVGEARVDVARLVADKAGGGLGGVFKHKAGGQKHGLAVFAKRRARGAAAHGQGFGLVVKIVGHGCSGRME